MMKHDYILLVGNSFLWGDGVKNQQRIYIGILSACLMVWMILDSRTVMEGALDGIQLCLWTVIPSLFPFFVISNIARSNIPSFRKILPVDETVLSSFLLGLLGDRKSVV